MTDFFQSLVEIFQIIQMLKIHHDQLILSALITTCDRNLILSHPQVMLNVSVLNSNERDV